MSWKEPKTELEFYTLTKKLWWDIYKNNYREKRKSKYYKFVGHLFNQCPLCEYHGYLITCEGLLNCKKCALNCCFWGNSLYTKWHNAYKPIRKERAYKIYKVIQIRERELLNLRRLDVN